MTTFDDRHPDLLTGGGDRAALQTVATLEQAYTARLPYERRIAMDQTLYQRMAATGRRPAEGQRQRAARNPRRRLAVGAMLAGVGLASAVAVGGAHAGVSPTDQVFQTTAGTAQIAQQHLGEAVHLSQIHSGFTATVNHIYADANRVVVAYTISGPAGRTFVGGVFPSGAGEPTLTSASGAVLPYIQGVDDKAGTRYDAYDVSSLAGTASVLNLRLSFPSVSAYEPLSSAKAQAQISGETYSLVGRTPPDIGVPSRLVTVNTPFAFDLQVPVDAAQHAVTVNQATNVGGETLTLQRVVVTPTETRLYVQGASNTGDDLAGPTLTVNGQQYVPNVATMSAAGVQMFSFDQALYNQHGTWTLTLQTHPHTVQNQRVYADTTSVTITMP